ncbi:MAG TPA: carboxypeptidase M32 [Kouleothrix sp.]|uniref:carboxypeptidase M32 n=1 Tax=Kouleothrix sp. TaxID=2779161 RepID=UPI002C5B1A1B|nr:carboxypeptidase M32 [Kouleothrix sp.]HRC76188.1 carboxypeptidase M32 [Kouleothrix sp.]
MEPKFEELQTRLREINDLEAAAALLNWDQTTYMPPGGAEARGRQLATLARVAHEKFTDDAIGRLLDDLRPFEASQPYDSAEASLLRVVQHDYERAIKVPAAFLTELYTHAAASYEAWARARPANDFNAVAPMLEKTLDLSRRYAEFFPGYEHIADPLIDESDQGMQAASVRALFRELRDQLVPLVQAITAQPPADESCLKLRYPEDQQRAFGEAVIKRYGYDFSRGRQDKTLHPYMTKFSIGDVRITTRFNEHDLGDGLFSTLHESGHAMYEQGINPAFEGTPLANGTSSGVHESQSRLWENIVGRSRSFWQHFYPQLQQSFAQQLGEVSLDTFYRAINKVQRSLIRVDADEVTYNLHVMLRFDFELALLEGSMRVRDLPDAWHERMESDLGVAPPDDRDGVLQDVHWYGGRIGGVFQGYTIGNILSAQFYDAATRAHPGIPAEIAQGEFGTLHGWLKENIYRHGRTFTAPELVQRATGGPLSFAPYIRYLRGKFAELYSL